jgi:hypothetical protein
MNWILVFLFFTILNQSKAIPVDLPNHRVMINLELENLKSDIETMPDWFERVSSVFFIPKENIDKILTIINTKSHL